MVARDDYYEWRMGIMSLGHVIRIILVGRVMILPIEMVLIVLVLFL